MQVNVSVELTLDPGRIGVRDDRWAVVYGDACNAGGTLCQSIIWCHHTGPGLALAVAVLGKELLVWR